MNTAAAFVLMFWIIAPILYCKSRSTFEMHLSDRFRVVTNVWQSSHFPISSYLAWDNTGNMYDATVILTDGVFDEAKFEAYSPLYMSVTLALAYGIAFAAFPAVFVHTFCTCVLPTGYYHISNL
jgi:hypothetical protein